MRAPRVTLAATVIVALLGGAATVTAESDDAAPAQGADFSGVWETTYGLLEMTQEGDEVTGTYSLGGGSTIAGTVEDNRLTFTYAEPAASGQGWFELAADGQSFQGQWLEDGAATWYGWSGVGVDATGTFAPAGSLAEARFNHTATVLPDGRVLVVGGPPPEVWDPTTESFGSADSLAEPRGAHRATALLDGRVLVVGDWDRDALASAEVWDPTTASFGPAGSLAEARQNHTATLLPDGRVLVVGGSDGDLDALASAEVWDPATASFDPAGSVAWDPATGAFARAGVLAEARAAHTATLLPDGRVLVVGGSDWMDPLATAEVWDPTTGAFAPAGALAKAREHHTATLLPDGRVLVVGGGESWYSLASAEMWDPTTASFGPAGVLAEAREHHTATLLPDGRVLVVGGESFSLDSDDDEDFMGDPLASAEVWDPATASFAPAGSLAEARFYHTATAQPDGRVLVVGGMAGNWLDTKALASAEVWVPAE